MGNGRGGLSGQRILLTTLTRSTGRTCRKRPSWAAASSTSRHGRDAFISLEPFGGFCWRLRSGKSQIRGTDPSSFTITEAYGTDGPVEERTICTDRSSSCTCRRAASAYATEARCGCSPGRAV
ncbi:MAG: hypothetical protein V8Q79_04130 [Christensenellales bacterium]